MEHREPRGTGVESVLRATRLLGCFRRGEPALALPELVRRGGYSKTTTYRILLTLQQAGWLERDEASAFRLTTRLFEIGSILVDSLDLRRQARLVMGRLSEECGLTVHLVIPSGGRAVCIERADHGHAVRILHLEVGESQPLHQGGAPQALLAHDEAALLPELMHELTADPATTTTAEELRDSLATTRRLGYSTAQFGTSVPLATLGVPVLGTTGRAVAGLGVCALREQVIPAQQHLAETLQHAASALSARLGSPQQLALDAAGP